MILQLEPARARAKDPSKIWDHPLWKLERKLNGWRFLMHFGRELDRTYLTGRRISDRTGVFSEKGLLVPQLHVRGRMLYQPPMFSSESTTYAQPLCDYTVLDGEIMPPPGCGFRDIASFMNTDYHQAQSSIAKWGSPTYHAFDALFVDGQDVRQQPMLERRRLLCNALDGIHNPLIKRVEQYSPRKSFFETEIATGGEGVVLKRIDGTYGESGAWIKVKRVTTLDVVVTNFTQAKFGRTGKYEGQIGAVVVSVRDTSGAMTEVAQVSGMDDATRRHMTDHPGEWLGRVVEIEAQEWGRDRLLHPRFVRLRSDVDPTFCTFRKMMEDLGQETEGRVVSGEQAELPL